MSRAGRVLERADDVVLVDELQARVEAEDRGTPGRRSIRVTAERRPPPRPSAKRRTQTFTSSSRSARSRRRLSASTMSRSISVRGGCGRSIVLGEERRVVLLAAVVVRAGLEDEALATVESLPLHAARMFIVPTTLFSCARFGVVTRRVDDEARVDDRVDLGRLDDAADQAVGVGDLDELGPLELDLRRPAVDPDDRLDLGFLLERLRQAPPQYVDRPVSRTLIRTRPTALADHVEELLLDARPDVLGDRSGRAPRSSCARSPSSSVGTGSRKRIVNFAGR